MSAGTLATLVLDPATPAGLEAAIDTARRLSMHLEVICLAPAVFHMPPPTMADAFMPPLVIESHAEDLVAVEEAVEARLTREDVAWSVSGFPAGRDALPGLLAQRLRFADLTLLPRSGPSPADLMHLFESVLYHSRAPILLTDRGLGALDRAMIAWDESDVALAAVRAAAPVLAACDEVEIVTVDLPDAGEDLAQMLSRRGAAPAITPLQRGGRSIAETLIAHGRETGADLIVAGAYGHARLREMLLGGVTRDLLKLAEGPLLLAR
jgi:nucleotide-binding universal stress UspA family protein